MANSEPLVSALEINRGSWPPPSRDAGTHGVGLQQVDTLTCSHSPFRFLGRGTKGVKLYVKVRPALPIYDLVSFRKPPWRRWMSPSFSLPKTFSLCFQTLRILVQPKELSEHHETYRFRHPLPLGNGLRTHVSRFTGCGTRPPGSKRARKVNTPNPPTYRTKSQRRQDPG